MSSNSGNRVFCSQLPCGRQTALARSYPPCTFENTNGFWEVGGAGGYFEQLWPAPVVRFRTQCCIQTRRSFHKLYSESSQPRDAQLLYSDASGEMRGDYNGRNWPSR
jgi:hypothetical protein